MNAILLQCTEDLERKTGAKRCFIASNVSLQIISILLKDKQTAAIKAIDQKIEKMKELMSGAFEAFPKNRYAQNL
ncbi:MAG: hypothetical protein IM638_14755 [Bacteroidetes bacterium]|nr:hypothetical protein [Bacteroidota bacterium]